MVRYSQFLLSIPNPCLSIPLPLYPLFFFDCLSFFSYCDTLPKTKIGFSAINLIYFFTEGPDEVKCWQIRRQSKAPQTAGAIHTDFERGFICAEVMKFEDLKELGSESAVKAAGKYRQEGKTYVVQDGDKIFFKFNDSGGGKK
ncbi:obg-like ATPase 1 [Hibiscus syriacus]|uniref:obg-like ATPase 1 n=1 Tax=Hibiscus syriacus TaxID=106335 RepID=UPI001920D105|nr:obg-like ATPase 1 [Hibiscus syriacus]